MAFAAIFPELIFAYPLIPNLLAVIKDQMDEALTWAKTQNLCAETTPVFARHLESTMISESGALPAVALKETAITPVLNADGAMVEVELEIDMFLMVRGSEPNGLALVLDTYLLALSQLWYQTETATLFAGYHQSAKVIGSSRRDIEAIVCDEIDRSEQKQGFYYRTALMRLKTSFVCA